jgi:hypothetical protein
MLMVSMPNRYDYEERSHDDELDTDSDVLQLQRLLIRQAFAGQHACWHYQNNFRANDFDLHFLCFFAAKKNIPSRRYSGIAVAAFYALRQFAGNGTHCSDFWNVGGTK